MEWKRLCGLFTYSEIAEPLISKCLKISPMVKTKIFTIGLNKKLAFISERTNKMFERKSDKNVKFEGY